MRAAGRFRDIAVSVVIALAATAAFSLPPGRDIDGLGLDLLIGLRHALFGARHHPGDSPIAIIAVDEESYRRTPLADRPVALWTPEIGRLVNGLLDAGVAVIGFDIVLSTSVDSFAPGYEREFLRALRRGGEAGRLVLGQVQQQATPILPFRGQVMAAGAGNVRPLSLTEDPDGVVRRVPVFLRGEPGAAPVPSFSLELAGRLTGGAPQPLPDGGARLGDRIIDPASDGRLMVNFDGGAGGIPYYSFADMVACVDEGRTDYLRSHFNGKAVLIGAVLDVEDRKLTSKRFASPAEGVGNAERCILSPMPGLHQQGLARATVPGVAVHASALRDLVTGEWLRPISQRARLAGLLLCSLFAAGAGVTLRSRVAAPMLACVLAALLAAGVIALQRMVVLPVLGAASAGSLSFAFGALWRTGIVERNRRALTRVLQLYLPAPVLERLLASEREPELGGEIRHVSVLFSDIANFTSISERQEPRLMVAALNAYFERMGEIIEGEGGFIDQILGDAIVAVFGAPAGPPKHAAAAIRAACAMTANRADTPFTTRVGVNTGLVLLGNIGTPRRFNYTVVGDTVNLASRLEGANKIYGTNVLVSEETRAAAGPGTSLREIDRVIVAGRREPVSIFTPVLDHADQRTDAAYAAALVLFRKGQFPEAARGFAALDGDPPAAVMARRAQDLSTTAPPHWDGVTRLHEK
jgi:adenylate cyclase